MSSTDRRRFLALAAAALGANAGCLTSDADIPADTPTDEPSNTARPGTASGSEAVAMANANFGFDVLDHLTARRSDDNYLFSPYSAGLALAMTYAGARAETRDQMRSTLHFDVDDLHAAWQTLSGRVSTTTESSEDGEPFVLRDANAVWGQTGYPWRQSYTSLIEEHYGASVRDVDFKQDPEAARRRINEWTANATNDTIENLFERGALTAITRLVLANAVYFSANWTHTFDPDATKPVTFTRLDGSTTEVATMHESNTFPYSEGKRFRAVALPYAGGDVEMLVVLPDEGTFEAVRASLDANRLETIRENLETASGSVALPKFGYRNDHTLARVLSDLGMPRAFSEQADFEGMATGSAGERLALDDVRQRTYVQVDEQGTEAAAVTGVEVAATSAPANPFEFVANRPFVYAIRHRETGAVFFLGQVTDPDR